MKTNKRLPSHARSGATCVASLRPVALVVCLIGTVPAILFAQGPTSISPTSRNPHGYGSVTMDYEGFTTPKYDVLVAATEIGRLEEVNVEVGDRVKVGQVIAKLEDGLQHEAVATAKWRAQMHGETDATKAETNLMKMRLDQLQALAKKEMARPDEVRRALADWEIAKSRELGAIEQDELRKLELSRYELQLQRRRVRAPMDGVVAEIFRSPGEYITPADPAVIRLLVIDQIYGVFNVPVEDIGSMKVADQVSVFLTSAMKSVEGTISSIAPDIDGESGTIKVKVLIENPEGTFRAGDRCQMKPSRRHSAARAQKVVPGSPTKVRRNEFASQRGVSEIR